MFAHPHGKKDWLVTFIGYDVKIDFYATHTSILGINMTRMIDWQYW